MDLKHCLASYGKGTDRWDHRMNLEPTQLFFMLIKVEAGDSVGWNSERPSV